MTEPFTQPSLIFYDVANELINNIADYFTECCNPIPRVCVVPGEIAWDDCQCDMLAASVQRWGLSDNFPSDGFTPGENRSTPCNIPWIVGQVVIQLIRCMPTPQGTEVAVPCSSLAAAAEQLVFDAYVILTNVLATLCDLQDRDVIVDYLIGEERSVGPQGDCGGVELTVSFAVNRVEY